MAVHKCVLDGNLPACRHALSLHVHLAVGRPVYSAGILDGEVAEGEGWVAQGAGELGPLWASAAGVGNGADARGPIRRLGKNEGGEGEQGGEGGGDKTHFDRGCVLCG